jgi:Isochorismatase family
MPRSKTPADTPLPNLPPLGSHSSTAWQVDASHADLTRCAERAQPPHDIAAHGKTLTRDLSRTALIVVDMQNDFCHPQGWLASIGVDVAPARAPIAPLAHLLPAWRAQGLPVIGVNWGNRPDRTNLSPSLLHVYNPDARSRGLAAPLPTGLAPVLRLLHTQHRVPQPAMTTTKPLTDLHKTAA